MPRRRGDDSGMTHPSVQACPGTKRQHPVSTSPFFVLFCCFFDLSFPPSPAVGPWRWDVVRPAVRVKTKTGIHALHECGAPSTERPAGYVIA